MHNIRFSYSVGAGVLTGPRTGDISPPGEVLSMDGKYPKILGPAGPNPERTFGPYPKFVRRGHELGAAASSARCRSHLSNSRFPSFPPRASRVPCLSGFVRFLLPIPQGPMIPIPSGLRPSPPDRGSRPHRADSARAEPLPYGKAPQERRAACGRPGNMGLGSCMVYTLNRFLGNRPGK